jgi:hypothetical protein
MRRFGLALFAVFIFFVFLSFVPASNTAHADSRVWPTGYWGPLLSCTGNYNQVVPESGPLKGKTCDSFCDLLYTGQNVVDFAMTLVIFVGAPAMITFGGIMLMIAGSGGSDENRKLAKDIIVSAIIGVGITLSAYLVLSTFLWLFGNGPNSAVQVSWPDIQCNLPGTPTP